jgi:tetratricopeptide (TPR) repeat protein
MVPYERNQIFVGRDTFLQKLHAQFEVTTSAAPYHGRVALFGLGGIGKTQTALEFIYRSQTSYSRIYWISAVTQESLLDGYEKIAQRAQFNIVQGSKGIAVAEQVLLWLKMSSNWLLVVDNLDDIDVLSTHNLDKSNIVDKLLPESGPGQHTLITTRNPNADHIPAQALELPLFEESDSVALLSALSGIPVAPQSEEEKVAQQISKELGNLPLAISQAGAYIKQISGSFASYFKHYAQNRSRVNAWFPKGPRPYSHSVATTWIMSFNEIRKTNSMDAHLFRLLAFLNPDCILLEFLKSGVLGMDDDLERLISDESGFGEALLSFETFSLVKWDRQRHTLQLHRLVQAFVKDEMSKDELIYFRTITNAICNQAFPESWDDYEDRVRCRLYAGQVMWPLLDPELLESEISAHGSYLVGWFLRDDGKITDSGTVLFRSVEIFEAVMGGEHKATLDAKDNLALTYWAQGKMTEAVRLQEEVLEKRRRILGEEHPGTLNTMHNLAATYQDQGKMTEAVRLQEEVLEKRRRILGEEHPDTLNTMLSLASTYRSQGKMTEAARLEEEVLEKRRRILGEEHPDTLNTMHNLAATYQDQGKMTEAVRLQEEVLEKRRRILGEEHPDTLNTMLSLASTYWSQGKMTEAARLEEEVLEKRRKILGEEHPDTLLTKHNLAATYRDQGKMTKAQKLEEEVRASVLQGKASFHLAKLYV